MKRTLCLLTALLLAALFSACQLRMDGMGGTASMVTATPVDVQNDETRLPVDEQAINASPDVPPSTADEAFHVDGGLTNQRPDAPLPVAVTVREAYQERNGAIQTTFRNHTLDFSGLLVELTGLLCDDSGTTVSLAVTYPEEWTNAQQHSMSLYMGFAFTTERGEVADFYKAVQSPLPAMAQVDEPTRRIEYRFHSATLTPQALHGCRTLTVVPFVDYWEVMYDSYANGRSGTGDILLTQGESCTYDGSELFYDGVRLRSRMEELSLSIPLPEHLAAAPQAAQLEPLVLPVTHWSEDWEQNLAHGYYENYAPFFYGTLCNGSADFSGLTFALESALVWDGGYRIVLKVGFPPAWNDEQCRALMSTGGPLANKLLLHTAALQEEDRNAEKSGRPDRTLSFPRAGFRPQGVENRLPDYDREFYYICEGNAAHLASLLEKEALAVTLEYRWLESLTFGETTVDLTTGEPYYVADQEAFSAATVERSHVLGEIHIPVSSFVGFEEQAALFDTRGIEQLGVVRNEG